MTSIRRFEVSITFREKPSTTRHILQDNRASGTSSVLRWISEEGKGATETRTCQYPVQGVAAVV